jgi:hypothetical protein
MPWCSGATRSGRAAALGFRLTACGELDLGGVVGKRPQSQSLESTPVGMSARQRGFCRVTFGTDSDFGPARLK